MKTKLLRRVLSILLCLMLLANYLPAAVLAETPTADNRVADPSTMDNWKELFTPENLNTENAGAVWTDKSVFIDASAFPGTGINRGSDDSFLVALSAIGSNMTVTGVANVPTDTVMILDLSSSMYNGFNRDPATVRTMLDSVNTSINKLQDLNPNNRVGVVVYYGGVDRNQSTANNSMVLLPLDRYSGTSAYLKANVSGGRLISVAVNAGVKNSAGKVMPQTTRTVTDVAGTYAQLGILDAMNQLLKADTTVPATAEYQPGAARTPVMIFMSDGEPTAATHRYTEKVTAGMGNNTVSIRSANETDFVTQLTAAYAKELVDAHYTEKDALFYSLSLGTSVSLAVMDPANHTGATISGYWDRLLKNGKTDITVYNSPNGWSAPTVKKTYTVSTVTANGETFPASVSQRNYVDRAFTATTASQLTDAFSSIVNQINLVSKYTPTLVSGNSDLSGYISFVDKVGQYMTVTDIKGILIDGQLYSGGELAKNFVAGGGELGTYDAPTALGDEMVHAVQSRLGLPSADAARTLIGLAYEHGQLRYNGANDYSNYIGWYANAAGEFLGFWQEGATVLPDATGDAATDPVFVIRSYGYLGAVDESHGVEASDLMYATVQVRKNIATGEESVAFAVPAALIPLVTYEVKLDINGAMTDLKVTGAEHPIRLVYEVALQEQINPMTVMDAVSREYRDANTAPDGSILFYTNQYEADNTVGYGKVNTYSYFNPSRQNDKYYYLEDAPVCTDTAGTVYTGEAQPAGTFYRAYTVYTEGGAEIRYRRLSDAALETAHRSQDGHWYIGKGNVHVNLEGYTVPKTDNSTDTLTNAYIPFVDAHNHSVGDLGYSFIVGATLGNNGRIALKPETGIVLSKTMAEGVTAPTEAFRFRITDLTDPQSSGTFPAIVTDADGTQTAAEVTFTAGEAAVELLAGQTIRIGGMAPGSRYTIREEQTLQYIPLTDAFTVTLTAGEMVRADFVNTLRGTGSLLISKEVVHDLGSEYAIPEDLRFTIHVRLEGVGTAGQTFPVIHSADAIQSVTTDSNGCFTLTLGHDQQARILNLPEGTVVSVTEPEPGQGFTASYTENGAAGDGIVVIPDGTADVAVINRYTTEEVNPVNLRLTGQKNLITDGSGWNGAQFTFLLQRRSEDRWETISTATVSEDAPTFDFSTALAAERFSQPGIYHYQVLERNGGKTIDGITYDATLHTFSIRVGDLDMDGQLEIQKVISTHTGNAFSKDSEGNWHIHISFTNRYEAEGCELVLDMQKKLVNLSGSPLVSPAGFCFGLFDGDTLIARSELSDGVGEARMILHYELADVGVHSYTLRELLPGTPIPGMTYDSKAYSVSVEVRDNGDGTMTAQLLSIDGNTDAETPVFTNVYAPREVSLPVDFVTKHLTGRTLSAGEFTFELRGTDNDRLLTGTNDAAGRVIFSDALHFDSVGIYHFALKETSSDANGVTADRTVYTLRVSVTDQGGSLRAEYQVLNLVGTEVVFENTYSPKPVTYTLGGTKELTGRVLLNDEFHFVMIQAADSTGAPLEGAWAQGTTNFADGRFFFHPLTFHRAGVYYYLIFENPSSAADFGIVYDTTRYVVALTVTDDLMGQLVVSDETISILDGGNAEAVVFRNRYVAEPTSAAIPGSKELVGKVLNDGAFTFELYEADENWSRLTWLETQANGADGSFAFSRISYDTAGTYYYLVQETGGGQTLDGVVYDDTVYRVTVEVTDDLKGRLHAETTICDADGIPQEGIRFRNLYVISGDTALTIRGSKALTGMALADGMFTFDLYQTDADFTPIGEPVQSAENIDGAFSLTLDYTADQAGSTLHYVLRERNGGQTVDGIIYDDTVYRITVELGDDGLGRLVCSALILDENGEAVEEAAFVNTCEPPPKTGDTGMGLWLMLMAVSAGGVITLLSLGRKKGPEEI